VQDIAAHNFFQNLTNDVISVSNLSPLPQLIQAEIDEELKAFRKVLNTEISNTLYYDLMDDDESLGDSEFRMDVDNAMGYLKDTLMALEWREV